MGQFGQNCGTMIGSAWLRSRSYPKSFRHGQGHHHAGPSSRCIPMASGGGPPRIQKSLWCEGSGNADSFRVFHTATPPLPGNVGIGDCAPPQPKFWQKPQQTQRVAGVFVLSGLPCSIQNRATGEAIASHSVRLDPAFVHPPGEHLGRTVGVAGGRPPEGRG